MRTTGNTILITGGTSGIGRGLALRFHAAGNRVIVAGRRKELLDELTEGRDGMESVVLDVDDPESIAEAHAAVTTAHPELNVLVNNAGIMMPENVLDPGFTASAEAIVTTNLLGTIRVTGAFAPFLARRDDAVIMNVSSGLAFVPLPFTPTYNATKAAIHSLSEGLRVHLADAGVQVIELVPPAVRTALMGQDTSPAAMPLEDFLTEAVGLLHTRPDAREILVENVKALRFAEADGTYADVLARLAGH